VELLRGALRAFASAAWLLAAGAHAQGQFSQVSEPAIKAAFLYKFAGYVEWPPQAADAARAPFVIGTLEADEVATELARLLPGRTIGGRPAVVRTVREADSMRDLAILFVGRDAPNAAAAVRAARSKGILTVTESSLEAGAAINFVRVENRVAFEVSLEAAQRGGHRISSRMLAVARRVVPKGVS
jgi:hypothetical protein